MVGFARESLPLLLAFEVNDCFIRHFLFSHLEDRGPDVLVDCNLLLL